MKKMTRITALMALAALMGSSSVHAQDPPNFDFLGFVPTVPSQIGGTFVLYSDMTNGGVVPTPIPMNFIGEQHTVVINGTLSALVGPFSQHYSPVTVEIWTDVGPSTPTDFANPSTFTDGTLILSGVIDGVLTRNMFPLGTGNIVGQLDWTGGTRLAELGANTLGWAVGGVVTENSGNIPAGYVEMWDPLIDQPVVAVDDDTWGAVKELYRHR
ncbi:MAG: hypothetical protein ACE5G2_11010 [Candidatus Krumholzibacteriia bacterium]